MGVFNAKEIQKPVEAIELYISPTSHSLCDAYMFLSKYILSF